MFRFLLVALEIFILSISLSLASDVTNLVFPKGNAIQVNGVMGKGEWTDAQRIDLPIANNRNVEVYFKYDDSCLYFAFASNLMVGYSEVRFPEILFDFGNLKGTMWKPGNNCWFHVSATDCISYTSPNDYSNCLHEQENWSANNFTDVIFNDIIEISIKRSIVHLDTVEGKTIGIAFDVTNTNDLWEYYPQGAQNDNPSTWATATFESSPNSVDEQSQSLCKILSSNSILTIPNEYLHKNIEIFNLLGERKIFIENNEKSEINIDNLPSGIYFVTIEGCIFKLLKY